MKRMFRYLKPYAFLAVISPFMMIGEVAADLCLPYLMSFIVNYGINGMDINDPESGSALAVKIMHLVKGTDFSRMDLIITMGVLMLLITLIGGFFGTFSAFTAATAAQGLGLDLRKDSYRKVMSLSIEQTDAFTTGSLVTRMTNDISMVVEFMEFLLRGLVRAPMFFIGGSILLFALNLQFGVIIMCTVPVLLVVMFIVMKRAIPLYTIMQKRLDTVNSVVQENVGGARVIKAYNKEDYECNRFDSANASLRDVNLDVQRIMALISPVLTILLNVAIIAVIYVGGFQISIEKAGMTTGSIMAAITYATQIINGLMMMTNMFQMISRATASVKRVNEILDTEPAIQSGTVQTGNADSPYQIELNHVCFHYPGTKGRPVLNDINLQVRKGEMVAIIGTTGVGKSSLAQLIPRFYDADEGEVRVEGVPVRDWDLSALRSKIGYVMQKSELFSATMAENIRWGKPEASDEEVEEAARTAQAYDFISGFSEGFDTYIAEKGASLSGGQKQRVSIARAVIRKPEILILDDCTSALDLATEAKVREGLRQVLSGTTVIMIAQRIASVQEADRIAVIEADGSIRHCASHEELLKISETYREIYQSQVKSGAYQGQNVKQAAGRPDAEAGQMAKQPADGKAGE